LAERYDQKLHPAQLQAAPQKPSGKATVMLGGTLKTSTFSSKSLAIKRFL
jgi:hypothetical protein